jgi:hypothetical protein
MSNTEVLAYLAGKRHGGVYPLSLRAEVVDEAWFSRTLTADETQVFDILGPERFARWWWRGYEDAVMPASGKGA